MKHITPKNNKGFTLLLAVLITSIILGISVGFSTFVIRELIISAMGRESQKAFFASDSGVECSLYWDLKQNAFATDGNDSYTKSLLHMDGTDSSTTFTDSATGGSHTWTAHDNVQIDTAQSKFGGASGLFDGNGDYISAPDSNDWDFVNADFTVDFWVRFNTVSSATFYGQRVSGYVTYIDYDNDAHLLSLVWWTQDPGYLDTIGSCAWTPSANTWYHIAVVRSGNTLYMFINGVSREVTLDGFVTMTNIPNVATVGWSEVPSLSNHYLNGWLDEFRISKGIARWTSNFMPPVAEYKTTGGGTIISCAGSNSIVGVSSISEFDLNFTNGACTHVKVDKTAYPQTKINSYGRNTCDLSDPNRVERALEIIY